MWYLRHWRQVRSLGGRLESQNVRLPNEFRDCGHRFVCLFACVFSFYPGDHGLQSVRRCLACYTFSFLPAHVHRSVACMRFPKHRIDLHKNTETDPVDSGLVPQCKLRWEEMRLPGPGDWVSQSRFRFPVPRRYLEFQVTFPCRSVSVFKGTAGTSCPGHKGTDCSAPPHPSPHQLCCPCLSRSGGSPAVRVGGGRPEQKRRKGTVFASSDARGRAWLSLFGCPLA